MASKSLGTAKQLREKMLLEFQTSCDDLEDEVGIKNPNERRLKNKICLLKGSYDRVLDAHASLIMLEKTSASDEVNRNWVKVNLRQPFKKLIDAGEDLLNTLGVEDDTEAEAKNQIAVKKRDAMCDMTTLEAKLKAGTDSLGQVVSDTSIWLVDNHKALVDSVEKLDAELTEVHVQKGKDLIKLLDDTEVKVETKRQQEFRSSLCGVIADLRIKLAGKTPARVIGQVSGVQTNLGSGIQSTGDAAGVQQLGPVKYKMKMAAMPVPKFSGKVVDYPEWRRLFKDCIESQYEESAAVMTLRTQALPDSLVHMVPRCADLSSVWEKLDKKFLDPSRVWKSVKQDLSSLDRKKLGKTKYMVELVNKLLDSEALLETVGMVHWLRQEDKIPEYEDYLSQEELLEWVRLKPKLSGTPWENFKSFLLKMKDEYEELSKAGTADYGIDKFRSSEKCEHCGRKGHVVSDCWKKKSEAKDTGTGDSKKKCWRCGSKDHLSKDCGESADHSSNSNRSKDKSSKKSAHRVMKDQDTFSNYLRARDCRWCGRVYNTAFSCSGCGVKWAAKSKADHCLAHCSRFSGVSAKERGEMVIKGDNCIICLHHEHSTDSCFGKDQQKTICGLDGCSKRHHPSLHSAPQSVIQSVRTAVHSVPVNSSKTDPGVISDTMGGSQSLQGKFMSRINSKKVQCHKVSWNQECWTGGTKDRLDEERAKDLKEMKELLKLPIIDGESVLLQIQTVQVKYGAEGRLSDIVLFWDNGSTCSLILTETAELFRCPGEPVQITIDTINGLLTRDTKLYCIELVDNAGNRVLVRAFGVEDISEIRNVVNVEQVKENFSSEVQSQWGKIKKRPKGKVHMLVGQEYAGFHPVPYEAHGNLVVYRSMFGQGWLLSGNNPYIDVEKYKFGEEVAALRVSRVTVVNQSSHRIGVSQARFSFNQQRDYYSYDSLGVEPPRRCQSCKGCRECSWRGHQLSKQESYELEYMENCVDFRDGKFHIKFPFLVDPHELSDNYRQVVRIAEWEEKKLEQEGCVDKFNELFQKLQDLGAVEEISDYELKTWSGAVHYISLQHVINEASATTDFRIVSNSSLKTPGNPHTLNSILAKGPNMLSDTYKILIRFRTYLRGLNSDVTKAYYQMWTGLVEKHVRRMVWRNCMKGAKWKIYGYKCVSFGDVPAAALLEICIRLTIKMFGDIDLKAAHRLYHDHFVDDITSGGSVEEVLRFKGNEDPDTLLCDGTMPQIMKKANLTLKAIALSGERDGEALQKLSGSVFGLKYSTEVDTLSVVFSVNVSPRKRGFVTGPDITKDTISQLSDAILTRRILLGIVNGQFDMLGIAGPLLIKGKVAMRDLFMDEYALEWDSVLPDDLRKVWISILEELVQASDLTYQRCVRPDGEMKQFWIVAFFDGSDVAYAAVVYCRWQMSDGSVVTKLLCSKSRVAPLRKLSTPRLELNGAVIACRLVWNIIQALEFEELPTRVLIGGDSETVLAAREKSGGALGEFFGNRVGECWDLQSKISEIVPVGFTQLGEWYHMPSQFNAADRPTRLDSKLSDLTIGSEWQDGPSYLCLPFDEWPWERNFASKKLSELVPKDELVSRYRGINSALETGDFKPMFENNPILEKFQFGFITNDLDRLITLTEPMFRWLATHRSLTQPDLITLSSRDYAMRFWFRYAMPATIEAKKNGRLKELTLVEVDSMLAIRGRAETGLRNIFGVDYLPVVMSSHRVAELVMLKAHAICDHKSVDITFFTSRKYCWIVGGRKLAKAVCKLCVKCRYLSKKPLSQKMSSLPEELAVPCPAFSNIGLDLAGPFTVVSMVKKRSTRGGSGSMKVWCVLVVCLNTRAVKAYLIPGYSTEDFFIAWTEIISDCGVPRKVHSDRGSQLVSAAGKLESLSFDWDEISNKSGGGTIWNFCPSGAQWRNGAVEAQVKRLKKSLEIYTHTGLSYAEFQSLLKKITSVLNSRPISARYGPRHTESDPDFLELITPNMLLTGRSGIDLPVREFMDEDCPSKRLAYRLELEHHWWERWKVLCFDSVLPTKSWYKEERGVKVGDIVLISYVDKSKLGTWKLGMVSSVERDTDGLIRTCTVDYRLIRYDLPADEMKIYLSGLKFKQIRVPVQRLSMVLPVEEHGFSDTKNTADGEPIGKSSCVRVVEDTKGLVTKDYCDVPDKLQLSDGVVLAAQFNISRKKKIKCHRSSRSIHDWNQNYCLFEALWKEYTESV